MEDVIFKYVLRFDQDTIIALPHGARPVHLAVQDDVPQLWIRHATPQEDSPTGDQAFCVVATGQPFPDSATHVGTFLSDPYVWHVLRLPF